MWMEKSIKGQEPLRFICHEICVRPPGGQQRRNERAGGGEREFPSKFHLPNIAPTISSGISTFFESFGPRSPQPDVGLLLANPHRLWTAVATEDGDAEDCD